MIVVVFTMTHRPDLDTAEYEARADRMAEIVSAMPGFLGMDYGETEDGEIVIARFESHEALDAWREQPEHKQTQELGRERYFAAYRVEVCELVRTSEFEAPASAG